MSDERREVRAKVRSYQKDGETKNVYATVGTAWVSDHGSKIKIVLETVPVSKDWDGSLYINKPYEKKETTQQDTIQPVTDEPINLEDIPF